MPVSRSNDDLQEPLEEATRGANRREGLERECHPGRVHSRLSESGQHEIGNARLQLTPVVQDLSPGGAAVQVQGSGRENKGCDIGRREKPPVRPQVIEPGETSNLSHFRVKAADLVEERAQFGPAFCEAALGKGPGLPVPLFGHEVKAHRSLGIGRMVGEAPVRRRTWMRSADVGGHRDPQEAGMPRATSDLVQEHRPLRISCGTPQAEATPKVGAAGNRLAEPCTGERGMPGGKAQLKIEVILIEVAGHPSIIARAAPTLQTRPPT